MAPLRGHPEQTRGRRRQDVDQPFQGHPADRHAARVRDREQRLDARRAIGDLRERLARVPLLDREPVGHMVGRDEVEVPATSALPQRILVRSGSRRGGEMTEPIASTGGRS